MLSGGGKLAISINTASLANGDSIAAYLVDAAGALLTSTLVGAKQSLNTLDGADFQQDSASAGTDYGISIIARRRDANTTIATVDGHYASLQLDSVGNLKVTDATGLANISILQQQVSVTSAAAQVPAANLASRKSLMLQNTSSAKMWIGSATVTTSGATAGIELPANAYLDLDVGPAVNVFAIKSGAGSLTLNVLEVA